jgi:hypothetical protein
MKFPRFTLPVFAVLLLTACLKLQARADEPELATSPALSCLTREPGSAEKPEYPERELTLRESARISIKLVFTRPDKAPDIKFDDPDANADFADSTRSYARGYRLPCLKPGEAAVTLKQEYYFDPNDGRKVMKSQLSDAADEEKKTELACMTRVDKRKKPHYPDYAERMGQSGKFLIEFTFTEPDKAPDIKWLAKSKGDSLKDAIEQFVADYRLPCLGKEPITATMQYNFILEGATDFTVFKDMTLKQFLSHTKDIPPSSYFDLNHMTCPFDVRVQYMRPYIRNHVVEIESSDPARKPLLEWLSELTLNLTPQQSLSVMGESFNLQIPCGTVDL